MVTAISLHNHLFFTMIKYVLLYHDLCPTNVLCKLLHIKMSACFRYVWPSYCMWSTAQSFFSVGCVLTEVTPRYLDIQQNSVHALVPGSELNNFSWSLKVNLWQTSVLEQLIRFTSDLGEASYFIRTEDLQVNSNLVRCEQVAQFECICKKILPKPSLRWLVYS